MKKIKLEIELTYDGELLYGTDKEAEEWFFTKVLGSNLELYDKVEIGDKIGEVKVMRVVEESANKVLPYENTFKGNKEASATSHRFIAKDHFNKGYVKWEEST